MTAVRGFKTVLWGALALALATLAVALPTTASAGMSTFCGGTYGGYGGCWGAHRTMWSLEGLGQDHSVCVRHSYQAGLGWAETGTICSAGPGWYAVYNIGGVGVYGQPWIGNNAAGSNRMQGRAYGP